MYQTSVMCVSRLNMSLIPDDEETGGKDKVSRIEKVAELEASLKEKTKMEEIYLNQLKYARADLENLQKHLERRIDEGVTREKEKFIMHIIPIAEEFDLALEESRRMGNSAVQEGIEMVRTKLWKVLNSEGLCPIEAVGKTFDPHMHEAVLEVETGDQPDRTIIQEVRKGYIFKGKVLRPSIVKVANNPGIKVQKVSEK
jgi:molecular chaperone GrpE